MFPANSRAVKSLRWVEENIGPINVLEFLLDFPGTAAVALPDQVQLLASLHTALQQSPHVDSVWSTATFLPLAMLKQGAEPFDLEAKGIRSTIRRAVLRKKLEEMLPVLQAAQLVHLSDAGQTWRLSIRVRDMNGENFNAIRKEMVERGLAILLAGEPPAVVPTVDAAEINSWELPACDLTVTGLRTVVERAHHALLSDLGISFMTAFVLITPVMMLIVRGVLAGCLLMIPNILPVAMVFGGMGWWGVQLDVASILTASVALGIAVDDTLHFISWYVRGRRAGKEPSAAVQVAISACWRPMLHTTLICTGAMLPFFFSDFLPTSKFALLMILILSGAILGDLILLPALLQGPLGKWIGKKREIASG